MRAALAPHGSLAGGDQWRNSRCERGSKNRTGRNVGCRRVGTMVATSCASWRAARPGAFSLCSLSHTNVESGRNLRGMVRGILKLNVNLLPLLGPRESDRCGAECIYNHHSLMATIQLYYVMHSCHSQLVSDSVMRQGLNCSNFKKNRCALNECYCMGTMSMVSCS